MTIAIVVVAIGGILAVAGVFAAVQARRNEPRYASRSETLGGTPDAAKVKITSAPAVKIEQVISIRHARASRFNTKYSPRQPWIDRCKCN
jgi:hypothetical protein